MYDYYYLSAELFSVIIMLLNIPFGYMRAGSPRFSRKRGRSIYIPILLGIGLRSLANLPSAAYPFLIAGTLIGQVIGGELYRMDLRKKVPLEDKVGEPEGGGGPPLRA